jgi:dephospho-CoA kinase
MFVFGLTGSIGMGKSTTAALFREAAVAVHDADAAVHRLYAGAAAARIEDAFPGTTADGVVDRVALSRRVLGDAAALERLEAIVHPLVREAEKAFLDRARTTGARCAALDVPLLLETGGDARCDAVIVVSAPPAIQRTRVLARAEMTEEKLQAILAKQMPDAEKRRRAHVVIETGRGFEAARRQVADVLRAFAGRPGRMG